MSPHLWIRTSGGGASTCSTWVFIIAITSSSSLAALAPGTVDKMKGEAPEVLKVEIVGVDVADGEGLKKEVVYEARVTGVDRSKADLKPGARIKIDSYYLESPDAKALKKDASKEEVEARLRDLAEFVGPKAPPLVHSPGIGSGPGTGVMLTAVSTSPCVMGIPVKESGAPIVGLCQSMEKLSCPTF